VNSTGILFIRYMSLPIDPTRIFVVIPAYNEAAMIRSVVDKLFSYNYSIAVVDDGSTPSLYPLLQDAPVHYLRHQVNLGQGAALQTGMEYALAQGAAYIVTFDADGQHEGADIQRFIQVLQEDKADIVLGSRFMDHAVHNMSARRKAMLQLARYCNYLFTGLLLTDAHNGLRALNRRAAEAIRIHENRMAHATEFLSQIKDKKLRYAELPVHVYYTSYSRAKGQSVWAGFRILFDLLLNKLFG
jgi:polyprenyl-phospho-N-acetylgalactosaminyl synthase